MRADDAASTVCHDSILLKDWSLRTRRGGSLLRLAGTVLVEAHDEWQVSDRRYLSEGSMALLNRKPTDDPEEVAKPELMTA